MNKDEDRIMALKVIRETLESNDRVNKLNLRLFKKIGFFAGSVQRETYEELKHLNEKTIHLINQEIEIIRMCSEKI